MLTAAFVKSARTAESQRLPDMKSQMADLVLVVPLQATTGLRPRLFSVHRTESLSISPGTYLLPIHITIESEGFPLTASSRQLPELVFHRMELSFMVATPVMVDRPRMHN